MTRVVLHVTAARFARAFTLVEVMLATVIIGLGVLGLSALFAGAAKTQIDTARITRASQSIDRAAESAGNRFGAVSKGLPNQTTTFNAGQYASGIIIPGVRTVWYAFSAYGERNNNGYPSHALTIDPSVDPTQRELEAFLLVETPEVVTYENPLGEFSGNVVLPVHHQAVGAQMPSGALTASYDDSVPTVSPFYDTFGQTRVANLPFGRLQPGTLRVRFEIATRTTDPGARRVVSRRSVTVDDAATLFDADDVNIPDPDGLGSGNPDGIILSDGVTRLLFNRALSMQGPWAPPGAPGAPVCRLLAFDIRLHANEWIERIVVEPGLRRADRLLTLDDRVFPNGDGTFTGVSALWRRARDGGHQLAMLAYVAEPITSGAPTPFIPPESGPVNDRLWRRVTLTLDYDRGAGRFTLSTTQSNNAFALATGQVLMIAGDGNNPNNPPSEPGAESFVRVVRTALGQGGRVTGYLDAPPRDRGLPLMWPSGFGQATGYATSLPTSAQQVEVWALAPQVRSLSPDNRQWRIRPVDGRIVDVR